MTVDQLTVFFGWCALINIIILFAASIFLMVFRDWIMGAHSRMMGVDKEKLPALYFSYLGNYKITTLVFALVPYLALRIAF